MTNAVSIAQQGSNNTTFRNRIINGAMMIDQRNAGASQTLGVGNTYAVDRWLVGVATAAVTGQRVAGIGGYQYAFRITGGASNAGVFLTQRIESYNVSDLVSSNVTFSCVIAASAITSITWTAYYPTVTDSFGTVTQIATGTFSGITSSAQTFTTTFNAGASVANGLQFTFTIGTMTSGTFTITGVQLEAGSTASPFEYRSYGTELALCQRYYFKTLPGAVNIGFGIAYNINTTSAAGMISFPAAMRTSPSALEQSGTASQYMIAYLATSNQCTSVPTFGSASLYSATVVFTVGAVLTAGQSSQLRADGINGALAYLGWSAEL